MNISYNWLKEYVDFDLTPDEVAAALTSIGLETGSVEEVQTIKGGLEGLVIGEVLTCEAHPNSDHMHVTTVNLGQGEPVQIVCGAPNVAAGQKVVVATLGTKPVSYTHLDVYKRQPHYYIRRYAEYPLLHRNRAARPHGKEEHPV